jgi:hypothetical protein
MTTLSATLARTKFYMLLDEVAKSHEPIQIKGKRHTAVLIMLIPAASIGIPWMIGCRQAA